MLKLKKLGAVAAAMALSLSLTTLPAAAADFTDVPPSFWGYSDITKMANLGLAGGYPDGTFKPNGKMTAAECLLFCARTSGVDSTTKEQIARDHAAELEKALPTDINSWAAKELALAMEMGVLSLSELDALADAGVLGKTITRENICMYLVRAMQLEPLAKSLTNYTLTFKDQNQISPSLKPYVYVLNNFGIVKGDDLGNFDPQGKVTRAQMTTMLSRAVDFIKSAGIKVELPSYTTYDWKAGTISAVTPSAGDSVILRLSNPFTGDATYTLYDGVKVYKDNMLTTFRDLKPGQYVRLNLSISGAVMDARLSGVVTAQTGSVNHVTDEEVSVTFNGITKKYPIDRFTLIKTSSAIGGTEVIDSSANYSSATCYVDGVGHLAGLLLAGGTQKVNGLFNDISTSGGITTMEVRQPNGMIGAYVIPSGTNVTINGLTAAMSEIKKGNSVQLKVNSDTGKADAVTVDTLTTYVQGPINRFTTSGSTTKLYIRDIFTNHERTYPLASDATLTYSGQEMSISKLEKGWYINALVVDDYISHIDAFPGTVTKEGILESITYGTTTTLSVVDDAGLMSRYELEIDDLPSITRSDKSSYVDQLRTGDKLVITIRFNKVENIDATPQTATLTGKIISVNHMAASADLELELADGTHKTYSVPAGTSVTQDETSMNIYDLKPGYTVGLVLSGDSVVAIEITAAPTSSTQVTGIVYTIQNNSQGKLIKLLPGASTTQSIPPITVDARNATIMNLGGSGISLSSLDTGDPIVCYGSYQNNVFVATIIIRQK